VYDSAGKLKTKSILKYNSAGKEHSKTQTHYLDYTLRTNYIAYWEGKVTHEIMLKPRMKLL